MDAHALCDELQKAAQAAAKQQAVQGAVAALRSAYERARAHDEDAAAGAEGHAGEGEACLAALKQAIREHAEVLHASPSAETTQLLLDAKALRERLASHDPPPTLTPIPATAPTLTLTPPLTRTRSASRSRRRPSGSSRRSATSSARRRR